MATITTVTKTASVVKTTKGSDKKWSEILSLNRRHDLQLPIEIAKYDSAWRRAYNSLERQKNQTERNRTHRHETWHQDDFTFRNRLLEQLKPITRRFRNIDSLPSDELDYSFNHQQKDKVKAIFPELDDELRSDAELPRIKQNKKKTKDLIDDNKSIMSVSSKIKCPKVLNEYEPRLHSHHHSSFLDMAQRFLTRHPETVEKETESSGRQKQQQRVKNKIQKEQERVRLATKIFEQQIQEEKLRGDSLFENSYDTL